MRESKERVSPSYIRTMQSSQGDHSHCTHLLGTNHLKSSVFPEVTYYKSGHDQVSGADRKELQQCTQVCGQDRRLIQPMVKEGFSSITDPKPPAISIKKHQVQRKAQKYLVSNHTVGKCVYVFHMLPGKIKLHKHNYIYVLYCTLKSLPHRRF